MLADRTRLKQVLINLLSNAIKYNRPGGSLTVGCTTGNSGRILVFAGGLIGAAGVALSAAAAHLGGAFVGTAASFLLMHAPVFLAVGLIGANRMLRHSGVAYSGSLNAKVV